MNIEKETISKEEAAATLKSVDLTKHDAIKSVSYTHLTLPTNREV